jgi:mannose-1-phosphate guanylyltransferase
MSRHEKTWAIVLAGGDGTRLARLTEALHCRPTPKQFASLTGGESMLQETLRRIEPLVPPERTIVVIARHHLPWIRAQLDLRAGHRLFVQPEGRGTGIAILAALRWISLLDPDAGVLIFPSDHHVAVEVRFRGAIAAAQYTSRTTDRLTLVGVVPDGPDPDYGWIVPGRPLELAPFGGRALDGFIEKPSPELARHLHAAGALWNTFIMAAPARVLTAHARRCLPEQSALLDRLDLASFAPGSGELAPLYERLVGADFSRDVLQHAPELAVVAMEGTGWSDWGTPDRVLATLAGTPHEPILRAHLGGPGRNVACSAA